MRSSFDLNEDGWDSPGWPNFLPSVDDSITGFFVDAVVFLSCLFFQSYIDCFFLLFPSFRHIFSRISDGHFQGRIANQKKQVHLRVPAAAVETMKQHPTASIVL